MWPAASLSRWERGVTLPPYTVVRAYEVLLGLPGHALVSVADTILRYFAPTTSAAPLLARPEPADDNGRRLSAMVDRATAGGVMTGRDWDVLTHRLVHAGAVVLFPSGVWSSLAERLLYEMAIADGVHWMQRAEAYQRLLAHPESGPATIATTAAAAADRSMQAMVGTISVLDASAHQDACRHVLRHLNDPFTDRTFAGAVLACVRKVGYGHYQGDELRQVLDTLLEILRAEAPSGVVQHAAMTLASLPPLALALLPSWARRVLHERHTVQLRSALGELAERVAMVACVGRWWQETGSEEEILTGLVHDALRNDLFDERLYAQFVLAASPHRPALAAAIHHELRRLNDPVIAPRLVEALRVLGGAEERRHIEELVAGPLVPAAVREAAALALGHIGGTTSQEVWRRILGNSLRRWARSRSVGELAVVDRVVYSLGMASETALLRSVATNHAAPVRIRRAASWWIRLPEPIRVSVTQTSRMP